MNATTTAEDEDLYLSWDYNNNILVWGRRNGANLRLNKISTSLVQLWSAGIQGTSAQGISVDPLNGNNFFLGASKGGNVFYNQSATTYSSAGVLGLLDKNAATPTPSPSRTPSVTPSISVSSSPSVTPSITPSVSSTPSTTPSRSATPSVTPSSTPSTSVTPSITPSTSVTPSTTPSASLTPSVSSSVTPSSSITPSVTPSVSLTPPAASASSSSTPSSAASSPTPTPSPTGSASSTSSPASGGTSKSPSTSTDGLGRSKRSSNSNTGIIAGGVIGGMAAITAAAVFGFLFVRRRQQKKNNMNASNEDNIEMNNEPTTPYAPVTPQCKDEFITSNLSVKYLDNIVIKEKIGEGNFGEVYRGTWNGTQEVALKKLLVEKKSEFLQEASNLQKCSFPHVVAFYGLYQDQNQDMYMVTEFMSGGALNNLLQEEGEGLSVKTLIQMARDAAGGMKDMSEKGFIHRDLAARNLLVQKKGSGQYVVKVADFGMSRQTAGAYYKASTSLFPIKWSAPEVLKFEKFSTKSDVWSFGVVMWEIFEFGSGMSNNEATDAVVSGYRLPKPNACPEAVYSLMLRCFSTSTADRPSFAEICDTLDEILQNDNFQPISQTSQTVYGNASVDPYANK